MKIKKGFLHREIMGKSVVISDGINNPDFNKLVALNDSAATLWKSIQGKEFTVDDLANTLVKEYAIDKDMATADAQSIVDKWIEVGLVEP